MRCPGRYNINYVLIIRKINGQSTIGHIMIFMVIINNHCKSKYYNETSVKLIAQLLLFSR